MENDENVALVYQKIQELEDEILKIKERNRKVEGDKAWEGSLLRKATIVILTYLFAVLYLSFANTANSFLGAVVPSVGFFLSTQTINRLKKWWLEKKHLYK